MKFLEKVFKIWLVIVGTALGTIGVFFLSVTLMRLSPILGMFLLSLLLAIFIANCGDKK